MNQQISVKNCDQARQLIVDVTFIISIIKNQNTQNNQFYLIFVYTIPRHVTDVKKKASRKSLKVVSATFLLLCFVCLKEYLLKQPPEVFCKKRCSQKCCKIHRKTQAQACNFIKKESLAQVFSCEFCEISKNTFFTEHVRTTASLLGKQGKILFYFTSKALLVLQIIKF